MNEWKLSELHTITETIEYYRQLIFFKRRWKTNWEILLQLKVDPAVACLPSVVLEEISARLKLGIRWTTICVVNRNFLHLKLIQITEHLWRLWHKCLTMGPMSDYGTNFWYTSQQMIILTQIKLQLTSLPRKWVSLLLSALPSLMIIHMADRDFTFLYPPVQRAWVHILSNWWLT